MFLWGGGYYSWAVINGGNTVHSIQTRIWYCLRCVSLFISIVNVKNLPEQALILHDSNFAFKPEQYPPLLSDTVFDLVYLCSPPSQLLEHDPLADQSDHWQLTDVLGVLGCGPELFQYLS